MKETKICKTCNVDKFLSEYHIAKKNKQGVATSCKVCKNAKYTPKPLPQTIFFDRNSRICTSCNLEKNFNLFYKSSKEKSGVNQKCKKCSEKSRKDFLLESKEVIGNSKKCGKCKSIQSLDNYVKDNSKSDGLSSTCQGCVKNYREGNKELFKKLKRQYSENNKEHILEYSRKYHKTRLISDSLFKLNTRIRGCIFQSFKNSKYKKNSKTLEILNCTIEEFKKHIESQFLNWMSWEKHGNCETEDYKCSFDFDHIVPVSYAKTEEEVYLLNHWSNFQPLCSRFNRVDKRATFYPCTNLELRITFWEDHYEYI